MTEGSNERKNNNSEIKPNQVNDQPQTRLREAPVLSFNVLHSSHEFQTFFTMTFVELFSWLVFCVNLQLYSLNSDHITDLKPVNSIRHLLLFYSSTTLTLGRTKRQE